MKKFLSLVLAAMMLLAVCGASAVFLQPDGGNQQIPACILYQKCIIHLRNYFTIRQTWCYNGTVSA